MLRILLNFMPVRRFIVAAIMLGLLPGAVMATAENPGLVPNDRHAKISRLVTTLFERSHYRQIRVDDKVSSDVLDRYIEVMDGNRQYFLASDIADFDAYRFELDDAVKRGDLQPAFIIYATYVERTRERLNYALSLLDQEPDFTVDEVYVFDRSELPWATSTAELDDLWRKRVKNDGLSLVLAGKTWDEAATTLRTRYEQVLKRVDQIKSDDVFEAFMNAYSHTLDPHSSYFSPRNSEEYRIQMSLSYDGIGASLQVQDDFVAVMNVIPGGPAAIDGSLKPNDRITAVGQDDDGEMVDVVGWRLDEVVQLIRGPGGSTVRLQVLPAGAAPGSPENVLPLVRDKIKLEAQAAHSSRMEVEQDGRTMNIGVIEVPSFYQDYNARAAGEADFTSTTADVRRLIEELQADGIDGLVIDLRNNGGGHLSEATSLTGLFVDRGPIVQLRNTNGRIEVLEDPVPEKTYDGPLAVLVNRYSASASEIFAAAIQDYNRGVVIGQQTFGKGTVQNLYPLDRYAPGSDPQFGQLTLTIGKYYRVTGGSTQHRGVLPDIELPSAVDLETVGESSRPSALPWDQIKPTDYVADAPLDTAVGLLQTSHSSRASSDPDFDFLVTDIAARTEEFSHDTVSLNLEQRKQEREDRQAANLARLNQRRAALNLEALPSLDDVADDEVPDIILDEAVAIVADMNQLAVTALAQNKAESQTSSE
ncbi:MAG: carboxy terminal-processing peptidase [Gammaproteobacteria bacterium]